MSDYLYSIEEIKDKVLPIFYEHGINEVYLFGSYAKGTANKDSDVDLLFSANIIPGMVYLGELKYALSSALGKEVDIFLGDFVLASYGTGAVMAVPSHDQRDFEYAIYHNIPMTQVIDGRDVTECAFEKQDRVFISC